MKINKEIVKISTGIQGLDEILYGGLIPNRTYVIRGGPGTGKTTLGMQFLTEGIKKNDQKSLLLTFTEEKSKIIEEFENKFDLDMIDILDLSPSSQEIVQNKNYDVFVPDEVEWDPIFSKIISKFDELRPERILIDGFSQLNYISNNKFEYRKNVLSLISYTRELNATTIISSEIGEFSNDEDVQFISDGIFNLEYKFSERSLEISKFRNSNFSSGKHTFKLTDEGMKVYPILKITNDAIDFKSEILASGILEIDKILKGGIERGTGNLISGASGVGKTTLGVQFIKHAAAKGIRSTIYSFEENGNQIINRCESINIPIREMCNSKKIEIKHINPMEFTPNEFSQMVIKDIQNNGTEVVMLDSIMGYKLLFLEEIYTDRSILKYLNTLVKYLNNENVTVILIYEIDIIIGDSFKITDFGVSYLADNIIFIRYLELEGQMKKAIGVLKKRLSDHEKTLREFEITSNGIKVSESLNNLRGILTGKPEIVDNQ